MDLIDFFYPQQAQAHHLRRMANAAHFAPRAQASFSASQAQETAELKEEVRFLSMILAVILKRLAETKTMSLADVQDLVDEVDGLDGVANGGLEPNVLRGLLGVLKSSGQQEAEADQQTFDAIAELHHRYRR
ncbi:MAG: hypothetical protein CMJ78_09315 [Planctomycetaceae bacterium]|nr:hypothetical protein [Planctomycetaceae bacterium]